MRNWTEVQAARLEWHVSPVPLLAALLVIWGVLALQAESWRRMVEGWGYRIAWLDGSSIWLLSSMAKYVPGKVWSLAGMAVMSERRGIPAWVSAASAILLQVLSLGTGALVVAI